MNNTYIYHTGVKGMKWGIRRYQNKDGTLTDEGKKRYGVDSDGKMSIEGKKMYDNDKKTSKRLVAGVALSTAGIALMYAGTKAMQVYKQNKIPMESYKRVFPDGTTISGTGRMTDVAINFANKYGSEISRTAVDRLAPSRTTVNYFIEASKKIK